MTAPLIAPLIPPRAWPGGQEQGRPATPRRLPVAAVPEVPAIPDASRPALIEAALVLPEQMGLSPADLTAVPPPRKPVPTFAG